MIRFYMQNGEGVPSNSIENLVRLGITFIIGGGLSTVLTLYFTRARIKAETGKIEAETRSILESGEIKVADMFAKFASTAIHDSEQLMTRAEKLSIRVEKLEADLEKCLKECRRLRNINNNNKT
jgi:uncharacterized membrane protein YgaE (UPF0421/DUF939 family)